MGSPRRYVFTDEELLLTAEGRFALAANKYAQRNGIDDADWAAIIRNLKEAARREGLIW